MTPRFSAVGIDKATADARYYALDGLVQHAWDLHDAIPKLRAIE